jgi:hypothetical protein
MLSLKRADSEISGSHGGKNKITAFWDSIAPFSVVEVDLTMNIHRHNYGGSTNV